VLMPDVRHLIAECPAQECARRGMRGVLRGSYELDPLAGPAMGANPDGLWPVLSLVTPRSESFGVAACDFKIGLRLPLPESRSLGYDQVMGHPACGNVSRYQPVDRILR
jgi:hypothetical protein